MSTLSYKAVFPSRSISRRLPADLEKKDPRNPSNSRMTPHSLMQEFLNQSEPYVWGAVTNGLKFRFLRDNASFTRAAFVEFDLETIMETDDQRNFYSFISSHCLRFAKRTLAEELRRVSALFMIKRYNLIPLLARKMAQSGPDGRRSRARRPLLTALPPRSTTSARGSCMPVSRPLLFAILITRS